VCSEDRPLLGAIERLINKKIETRIAEGFERGSAPPAEQESRAPREQRSSRGGQRQPREQQRTQREPRQESQRQGAGKPQQQRSGGQQPQQQRGSGQRRPAKQPPLPDFFNKPYEPSPSAISAAPADDHPGRKRAAAPVPALFRKKAA